MKITSTQHHDPKILTEREKQSYYWDSNEGLKMDQQTNRQTDRQTDR